jgi:hypothetical protein
LGHQTIKPRPLVLEELIPVLLREREEQRSRITQLTDALAREDYAKTTELLESLSGSPAQHIVDDETQMLKLFLDAYGREGTSEAIKLFQQHRSKHKRVLALQQLGATSPKGLNSQETEVNVLEKLAQDADQAEEDLDFPLALKNRRQASKR